MIVEYKYIGRGGVFPKGAKFEYKGGVFHSRRHETTLTADLVIGSVNFEEIIAVKKQRAKK
jgi:hypothetical protein